MLKFISTAELVSIKETIAVCRDEKDNKFLELAVSGNANIIVTGDLDLLVLNPFQTLESDRIEKSLVKTLRFRFRVFVENENAVFFPV